ncbi:conserved hypothetical protein [Bradyrhizobium sp. ORS 278]|nr:conserved hypothetical protein [Bradyrhizobium sp. ORS 278]
MSDADNRDTSADQRAAEAGRTARSEQSQKGGAIPPAGPHARPDLTDRDKTPGTGMLPEPDDSNPSPTG